MARDFDGSNDSLHSDSPPVTAAAFTMACWFNVDDATVGHCLMCLIDKDTSGGTSHEFTLEAQGTGAGDPVGLFARAGGTGQNAVTSTGFSTGVWHHACAVVASATDRSVFIDGGSEGNNTNSITPSGIDRVAIGRRLFTASPNIPADGRIAEAAIWDIALSDAEVALLAEGVSPLMVRPDSLVAYWPLIGNYSPEIDLVGGVGLTVTEAAKADHPRIFYPVAPRGGSPEDAGQGFAAANVEAVSALEADPFVPAHYAPGEVEAISGLFAHAEAAKEYALRDNYILKAVSSHGASGAFASAINLASYVPQFSDPPDFGTRAFVEREHSANHGWLADSAAFGYARPRERVMTFPVVLPSSATHAGLAGLEMFMRSILAQPNLVLDIQVEGVASDDAVRFDVLHGRYQHVHDVGLARENHRRGVVVLRTSPYGYLPTSILLASAASVGMPGFLRLNPGGASWLPASILGDAPGWGELFIKPASVGTSFAAGSWGIDTLMWSLGAPPGDSAVASFRAFIPPTYFVATLATYANSNTAPASHSADNFHVGSAQGWRNTFQTHADWSIAWAPNGERVYRGPFRAFAYMRLAPSMGVVGQVLADLSPYLASHPMPSHHLVATVSPERGASMLVEASQAFQLLDLGVIDFPAGASDPGAGRSPGHLRLWTNVPSTSVPTVQWRFGGLWLQPLGGPHGIMPRGVYGQGTISATSGGFEQGGLYLHAKDRRSTMQATAELSGGDPYEVSHLYRGLMPLLGASVSQLDICGGARRIAASGATAPLIHSRHFHAQVSLRYTPRFLFLR